MFIILEFKIMSDVTDQYIERSRHKTETLHINETHSVSCGRPYVRLYNDRGGRLDR